jgi:pimeloyl-ACP methyl ester carboxylesterase
MRPGDAFAYSETIVRERQGTDLPAAPQPPRAEGSSLDLNYVRRGASEPLLLLHSLGGSLIQWSPVMDALAAKRDVVAVDMPGFGDSPPLPLGIEPTSANLATAVLGFWRSLGIGETPDVAGISLGAWTAIECARQGGVRSVVALSPAGFWREPPGEAGHPVTRARPVGRLVRPFLRPLLWTAAGRRRVLGRSFHHAENLSPAEALAVARAYITAPAYPEASALMRAGRVEDMQEIKVPVTLGWAEYDRLVRNRPLPPGVLPSSVHQVALPGCGHVPTWDDPDLVSRVILEGSGPGA